MKNNIKFKCISIGLATIVPLAVFGVVTQSCISKKEDDKNFIKVTFNPGEGRIISGSNITNLPKNSSTLFGNINKPSVQATTKKFAGWVFIDSKGNQRDFSDQEVVNSNITVTANYVEPGINYDVWFTDGGDASVSLSGNTFMEVKPGKFFFMINKPIATKPGYKFEYWEDSDGNKITNDYQFTSNLTLRPHFRQQLSITFGQPADVTVTYNGPTTVNVSVGDSFASMGRPDAFATNRKFNGWCTDEACTKVIDESTFIFESTSPTTLYPKMIVATDDYHTATYHLKTADITAGGSIQGNPTVAFLTEEPYNHFDRIPHVLAILPGKSFYRWVINTGTEQTPVWTPVGTEQVINNNQHIYAEFKTDGNIYIDGDESIYTKSNSLAYQAYIYPTSIIAQSNVWSIDKWTGSEENKPTIDSSTGIISSKDEEGTVTIKMTATLSDETVLEQTKEVKIVDPTKISSDYWIEDTTGYVKLDVNTLTDPDAQNITGIKADKTIFSIDRNAFNYQVKIGAKVTSIPDNFLINCNNLTYAPVFVLEDEKTVANVTKIGSGFMYGDTALSEAITIPESVTEIGDEFLANCTSFNSTITLPSSLTKIGSMFMMNCQTFNQEITIPSSVIDVGSYFMINVDAFTNTLTIECSATAFKSADLYSFSTNSSSAAHYQTGAIVAGTGADGFKSKFPAADGSYLGEEDIYRKYRTAP